MNRVVVGVGSNIDPEKNVSAVKTLFRRKFGDCRESRFVETPAIGADDQPNYLNGALLIETELALPQLQAWLRKTEHHLGRQRTEDKYAPRTMDLDVLVWNGRVLDPQVHERWFLSRAVEELLPGCLGPSNP